MFKCSIFAAHVTSETLMGASNDCILHYLFTKYKNTKNLIRNLRFKHMKFATFTIGEDTTERFVCVAKSRLDINHGYKKI